MKTALALVSALTFSTASFAQTGQEWRALLLLDSGPVSGGARGLVCATSAKGTIRVKDGMMIWFVDTNPKAARWQVRLAPDGSADATVPILTAREGDTHVTVPAGSGPRIIHSAGKNACRYRYEPE